jgi:hypothetical protein
MQRRRRSLPVRDQVPDAGPACVEEGPSNSLRTGNLTGNFSGYGPSGRFSCLIDQINQRLAPQFPEHERTANFFARTGNFLVVTGNFPFPDRRRGNDLIPGHRKVRLARSCGEPGIHTARYGTGGIGQPVGRNKRCALRCIPRCRTGVQKPCDARDAPCQSPPPRLMRGGWSGAMRCAYCALRASAPGMMNQARRAVRRAGRLTRAAARLRPCSGEAGGVHGSENRSVHGWCSGCPTSRNRRASRHARR